MCEVVCQTIQNTTPMIKLAICFVSSFDDMMASNVDIFKNGLQWREISKFNVGQQQLKSVAFWLQSVMLKISVACALAIVNVPFWSKIAFSPRKPL